MLGEIGYLRAMSNIFRPQHGLRRDRTGVSTYSKFGVELSFHIEDGFPLLTSKEMNWPSVVSEVLWMLEGSTDEARLRTLRYGGKVCPTKKTIWTPNRVDYQKRIGGSPDDTAMGNIYGKQWRAFESGGVVVDQIKAVLHSLKTDPYSRRHVVSAWNPVDVDSSRSALPPCHVMFQFYVTSSGYLDCILTQRSCDMFLGAPYNIAGYSLITAMFARECGFKPGRFIHLIGDAHIYSNHVDQVRQQMGRLRDAPDFPRLHISDDFDLMDRLENGFRDDDVSRFTLSGYAPLGKLSGEMAV